MKTALFDIRESVDRDAAIISMKMDAEDEAECMLVSRSPYDAIVTGMKKDDFTFTVTANGTPVFIFGGWVEDGYGRIWGLGSSLCRLFPKALVNLGKAIVERLLGICNCWVAVSSAESKRNHRWMRRIGFTVEEPSLVDGLLLCRCLLEKEGK